MADIDPKEKNRPSFGQSRKIKSTQKACNILDMLKDYDGATVTEIANNLGISKGVAHTHLVTLEENSFVTKDGKKYYISLKFLAFNEAAKGRIGLFDIVKQEADRLAEDIQEATQFLVEEHGLGVYLYISQPDRAVPTGAEVGDRKYLHCTALGKATLAHLPDDYVNWIIDEHGLPEVTNNTITDRDKLFDRLKEIRERGVAFDDEESEPGQRCVAAPIVSFKNQNIGAISVAGPANRLRGEKFREDIPERLNGAVNAIEINSRYVD